ncbi:glycerate kinase [Sphingobium algorifonticola]|uniref:Uncharacterized protein n=1 Tax=Sphingobium algorifonticola TaxID=2008318 RepID=A0A437JC31_9SPHN|nr:glycerate kinase [Sphingobium algorifonticola]RVT43468.1 hypothetical protein ENE74_02235 [Sphingobium algorifonticola]
MEINFLALRPHAAGKPVVALAGAVPPDADDAPHRLFDALLPIGPHPRTVAAAIAATEPDLVRTAKSIGDIMHLAGPWQGPPTALPVS